MPSALDPTTFRLALDEVTGLATVTLDRPERLNALTFQSYAELRDAFRALGEHDDVRAVLITGTGRAFCSGGDVNDIIGALFERDAQGLLDFTRMTCDLIAAIAGCPKPVVAGLNGTVAGAGAVIASAGDIRVAAQSAKIAFLFTRVGLSGADMGAAWLLPRLVGIGRASELLLTGRFVAADEAERIGLYNRVVADEALPEAARETAIALAGGPAFALAKTKALLQREATMTLFEALACEAQEQAVCMTHPDFREAYEAFVAKRKPKFA